MTQSPALSAAAGLRHRELRGLGHRGGWPGVGRRCSAAENARRRERTRRSPRRGAPQNVCAGTCPAARVVELLAGCR